MTAIDLNDYFYFVHVVEKRGFSAAAQALGMPKSRLSRHIAALEARLDTRLIQRTTRQFNVTDRQLSVTSLELGVTDPDLKVKK